MHNTFITLNQNDSFSLLKGLDLQALLIQTENCFLEYRDQLYLPHDLTFGVEIEYEGLPKILVDQFLDKKLAPWHSKIDFSLKNGGEITSPVMTDKIEFWNALKMVCDYLVLKKVDTLHNAGGHIHIGTCILGEEMDAWRQFLKLYIAYENVLFRFGYGDKIRSRKRILTYAFPLADNLYSNLRSIQNMKNSLDLDRIIPNRKNIALSFYRTKFYDLNSKHSTLEFRFPNATSKAVIWQNNINAFSKMLIASKQNVMDEEFLDYKLQHEFLSYASNSYLYNEINLKNALEFVDLVFDNNLDKIYFLRQYLKNFQGNYRTKIKRKAKNFVK